MAEYDGGYDKDHHVSATEIQAPLPDIPETKEKKDSKKSILMIAGTTILLVGVCITLLTKTKK